MVSIQSDYTERKKEKGETQQGFPHPFRCDPADDPAALIYAAFLYDSAWDDSVVWVCSSTTSTPSSVDTDAITSASIPKSVNPVIRIPIAMVTSSFLVSG